MAQRLSTPSGAQLLALAANRAHARRIAETLAAKVRPLKSRPLTQLVVL